MERERRWRQTDGLADRASRQAARALLDQKAIDLQTIFVRERAQGGDCVFSFHAGYDITRIIVMSIRDARRTSFEPWDQIEFNNPPSTAIA